MSCCATVLLSCGQSPAEARANLVSVLDSATEDLKEVVITRTGREPVVVVALSEYRALKETAYLLGNPADARPFEGSTAWANLGAVPLAVLQDREVQACCYGFGVLGHGI
ncbi:type II toxin-antitoxin system Phd/YefM family antitoxin [Nocardia sp. NPDC004260]